MAAILLPILLTDMEMARDADEYVQLKQQNGNVAKETFSDDTEIGVSPSMTSFPLLNSGNVSCTEAATRTNVDLSVCQAQNADFVAWLQIPGTAIDYPVVWTDDTNYYLNHTFTGKKSYIGTLFSLKKTDYSAPSRNIAIYGHHIRSNDQIMFSPLLAYKDAAFYAEHKIVYLDTLYHTDVYTVFAIVNMQSGDWEPSTSDFASDEAFLAFMNNAKAQALYDTGVAVQASDHILTLITCDRSYGGKAGRLIVMAVKQ